MGSILNISLTGMSAAQAGLQTVQHNVANASTEGYTRQIVHQTSTLPNQQGKHYIGTGTTVDAVSRVWDRFLTDQVNSAQSTLAAVHVTTKQIESIDGLLADASAGIAPAIAEFFKAGQQVGAYPASIPARQSLISAAQVLTNRFSIMGEAMTGLNEQMNLQVQNDVDSLNSYAKDLAELNNQIARYASSGAAPNDLLDKRDLTISEMGKLANISTTRVLTDTGSPDTTGNVFAAVQVYIGDGHLLVGDRGYRPLTVIRSEEDPTVLTFSIEGNEIKAGDVTGGSLGGILSFRNDTLKTAQNALGQVAYALASTMNAQQATGMDLLGNDAGDGISFVKDFFTVPSTVQAVGIPGTAPAMAVTLETPTLTGDTASDYYQSSATRSDYTLSLKNGTYTMKREVDGHTWTDTSLTGINTQLTTSTDPNYVGNQGFTVDDAVAPADGTVYKIRPMAMMATSIKVNEEIAGDVRKFAAGLAVTASVPASNNGYMTASVVRMINGDPSATVPDAANPLTLTYSGGSLSGFPGTVDVTDLTGNKTTYGNPVPFIAGASYNVDGIVFTMSGQPEDGDVVKLQRNDTPTIGVSDSSNMLLMNKLESSKVIEGATTFAGSYAQMVADVGNQASALKTTQSSQQTLLDLAKSRRDAYSGVNLDEEAANLLLYQQMYQANAKALQAGQKLFDTLISIIG